MIIEKIAGKNTLTGYNIYQQKGEVALVLLANSSDTTYSSKVEN
jgi:hypothetical protein